MTMDEIQGLRARIDELDDEILRLIQKRARLALEIGRLKAQTGRKVEDAGRENEILAKVTRASLNEPIGPTAAKKIFAAVIESCREIQREDIAPPAGAC